MTVSEATRILRPPLRFGDPLQVNARKFLEKVEEGKEAVRACKNDHQEEVMRTRWPEEHIKRIALCDCLDGLKEGDALEVARVFVNEWKQR